MEIDYHAAKLYVHNEHYYGREMRRLFLLGAILMLVSLPFFASYISLGLTLSLSAIVILGISAGLLNPLQPAIAILNLLIAVVACTIFEWQATMTFPGVSGESDWFLFSINQGLALIFFFSVYF